jgi:hypothetical protein
VLTSHLAPLRRLRHVRLASCSITGVGVRAFATATQSRACLRYLDLSAAAFVLMDDWLALNLELGQSLQVRVCFSSTWGMGHDGLRRMHRGRALAQHS